MRKGASALAMASVLLLGVACGGSSGGKNGAQVLKELHDPKAAPTATLPATVATAIPAGSIPGVPGASGPLPDTYIVKSGDTLGGIAATLGVPVADLARANAISDPTRIQVGQPLKVPRPGAPTPGPAGSPASGGAPFAGSQVPPTGGAPSGVGSTIASATPGARPTPGASASATASVAATVAASAAATVTGAATEYTVKTGDSACAIAIAHSVSVQELAAANGVTKDQLARLSVGQLLKIPAPTGNRGC